MASITAPAECKQTIKQPSSSDLCQSFSAAWCGFGGGLLTVPSVVAGIVQRGGHEGKDAGYQTDDVGCVHVHCLTSFVQNAYLHCDRVLRGCLGMVGAGARGSQEDDPVIRHAREACGDQALEGLLRVLEEAFLGHLFKALLLDADEDLAVFLEAQRVEEVVDRGGGVDRVHDDVVVKYGHRRELDVHRLALRVDFSRDAIHVVADFYDTLAVHGDGVAGQGHVPVVQTAPDVLATAGLVQAGVGCELADLLERDLDLVQGYHVALSFAGELEHVRLGLEDSRGVLPLCAVPGAAAEAGKEADAKQRQDHAEGAERFLDFFHGASPFFPP